jgi:hypothetical protein
LFDAQRGAPSPEAKKAETGTKKSSDTPGVAPAELAAWQAIATALLNLDEMITKG